MTPTHKTSVNNKKEKIDKPWLKPQGNIIPNKRNPRGKRIMAWAIGNQELAHSHHYDQHQGNVFVRKISVTYQMHHRKNYAHQTNTQSQRPITNATAALATKQVSPQLIMSKDVRTVSASNHAAKMVIRRKTDGEPSTNQINSGKLPQNRTTWPAGSNS
jgi:hypothetical protein